MTNSQRLATVRAALSAWILSHSDRSDGDQGQQESAAKISSESILIRDEFYCGRKFNTASHRAVWFIEQDELKIYNAENELCVSLNADQITSLSQETSQATDAPSVIQMPQRAETPIRRAA